MTLIDDMRQLQNDLMEDGKNVANDRTLRPVIHTLQEPHWIETTQGHADEARVYDPDWEHECSLSEWLAEYGDQLPVGLDEAEIVDSINNESDETAYWAIKAHITVEGKYFLTRKHAETYLNRYGYNHEPHTYPYTEHISRNPELEALIEFIKTIDFDKSNIILKDEEQ